MYFIKNKFSILTCLFFLNIYRKITVDNTKNALKKIGQSLPNLKKL